MENRDKGLTVPKRVINRPKKDPNGRCGCPKTYLPKLFAQAQKFGILMKKASFASIVSDHKQAGLEW